MPENKDSRRQMTPEEIETVRHELLERKKTLWNEILQELTHKAGERHQTDVDTIRESGDRALADLLDSSLLYLVEMKARELEDIEAALNRMDDGTYGQCVDCGEWIKPARLKVMPYSVRCIKCQDTHERIENI